MGQKTTIRKTAVVKYFPESRITGFSLNVEEENVEQNSRF